MGSNKLKYGDGLLLFGGASLSYSPPVPSLPSHTIRCKFAEGYTPSSSLYVAALVDAGENIWDIYRESDDWHGLFYMYGGGGAGMIEAVIAANTTGVTSMYNMFYGAGRITSIPLFDTSSVTDTSRMFYDCTSLTSVPLFDTGNVTDMAGMFTGCTSLTSVPLFDTGRTTLLYSMFYDCTSLQSVPLFDTSSALNLQGMFQNCTALRSIPQFSVASTPAVANMFYDCTGVESGILEFYQRAVGHVTWHGACFRNCGADTESGAAELELIPNDWK